MAKHKLSERTVKALVKAGERRLYGDGGNLFLSVNSPGHASWTFLYKLAGKQHPVGLGSIDALDLTGARAQAEKCRQAVHQGKDPRTALPRAAEGMTFDAAARALIASMSPSWKGPNHRTQWRMNLLGLTEKDEATENDYCVSIRNKPIGEVSTEDALRILTPVWQAKPSTATRLRMRLERVWDYAKVLGHCTGANPFRWRSHLSILLPKPKELTRGHNAAVHYNDLPAFWERLRGRTGIGVEALRFTILTAVRTAEATGARWDEINFDTKVWTVPGVRMKMGKEHEVPLSAPALDLLRGLYEHRRSEFVFPGTKRGCPISTATMYAVLIRMGVDVTTHGFRSTFRDWCGDTTDFERDIIEMALAHEVKGVEGDYRRSRALEKRRVVMAAWARYCTGAAAPDNVIPLISAA